MGGGDRSEPVRVGLISDTHDRLPESVAAAFEGVARIVHAGDVSHETVIAELESIAPVTAARGNCDDWSARGRAPTVARVNVAGRVFIACHDRRELRSRPDTFAGADVIVTGHTHEPSVETEDGVVWVNPGSASRPLDGDHGTVGVATIAPDGTIDVAILQV